VLLQLHRNSQKIFDFLRSRSEIREVKIGCDLTKTRAEGNKKITTEKTPVKKMLAGKKLRVGVIPLRQNGFQIVKVDAIYCVGDCT
jgi:hypothetical protein